jgi:hypothetical protein
VTFKGILNRGQLMTVADQEEVAKVFIGAFLEASLHNRAEYLPLFTDARKGKQWLPESIYLSQFEDSNTRVWANFDEDFELTSISSEGKADGENLSVWREAEVDLEYGKKGSRAVYLGWNYEKLNEEIDTLWKDGAKPAIPDSVLASYSITLDSMSFRPDSTSVLIFSLAESTESSNPKSGGKWKNENESNSDEENEEVENDSEGEETNEEEIEDEESEKTPEDPLDFMIVLADKSGEEISFLLSEFSHLQRQIKSRVLKIDFLDKKDHSENIFQTFRFDLEKLKSKNPDFSIDALREIRFEFDQNESGIIILDQFGFTKK